MSVPSVSTTQLVTELIDLLKNDTNVTSKVRSIQQGRPNYSALRDMDVYVTSDNPQMTESVHIGYVDYTRTVVLFITQRNYSYTNSDTDLNALLESLYAVILDNPQLNGLVNGIRDYRTEENPLDEQLQNRETLVSIEYRIIEKSR